MESTPLMKDEQPPPTNPAYPPQAPPGYQQAPYAPPQHVVSMQSLRFTENPVQLRCNTCGQDVVTRTMYTPGLMTWLIVGILFILGIWPCCLIPLCVDGLKDVDHVCPNCGTKQGSYKRLS
ncbi:Lipopolysaccharide-induced tumor necrosis factor-alpha factor homolog [Geodia barretti]|uniref:Lipopolysaccharide-induced tumor necrosis factor-alpha factor homolog n=1 Tax=Geodia barretti TaxID=519541 RepID=A0AA35X4M7_GEOBA|nr:Lipopolysaccharide-induced tumor necrosis factor-alpha factor homolog [Geodia barretti]